jgi:hypothetical protein
MGVQVMLACGSNQLGEAAANDIVETTAHTGVTVMQVDLSSPASVCALISTGRGYRHGGVLSAYRQADSAGIGEGAAATGSVSNLTKALKETFG